MNPSVPELKDLLNPTIDAIRALGGSGSNGEIRNKVIELMALPDEVLDVPHRGGSGSKSELDYRLPWARTHLKRAGLITNSSTGVWSLTPAGIRTGRVDLDALKKMGRSQRAKSDEGQKNSLDGAGDSVWREQLSSILADMAPDAFERLCQRLLRESGFSEVKVTGRSGDGGIDGHGIIRLRGLISFPVMFQCKRYKSSVGPGVVRDFRGAMAGRSDRGLILTTSTFSHEARREATRVSPPIDLIDGDLLIDRIKATNLGVETRKVEVEEVTVKKDFFHSI